MSVHAHIASSQKFRLTPVSKVTGLGHSLLSWDFQYRKEMASGGLSNLGALCKKFLGPLPLFCVSMTYNLFEKLAKDYIIHFGSLSSNTPWLRSWCSNRFASFPCFAPGRIQPVSLGGWVISEKFGCQVSRVHYCKRDEVLLHNVSMTNQLRATWPYITDAVFRIVQNHGE